MPGKSSRSGKSSRAGKSSGPGAPSRGGRSDAGGDASASGGGAASRAEARTTDAGAAATGPAGEGRRDGPAVVWLRDDLRLDDNPALVAAIETGRPVVALYVLDEATAGGGRPLGGASRWWLHHSLAALGEALGTLGVRLVLKRGDADRVVPDFADAVGAGSVHWNRRYHAAGIGVDTTVKAALREAEVAAESHHANLLYEPWTVKTGAGKPYRVFTPFWRQALGSGAPRAPHAAPEKIVGSAKTTKSGMPKGDALEDWNLLPTKPDWSGGMQEAWTPGEAGAQARLDAFLDKALAGYVDGRDVPGVEATSMLSPHLRFGEISPFRLFDAAERWGRRRKTGGEAVAKFQAELGWREFSWHILHFNPDLAFENFDRRFDGLEWRGAPTALRAWQRGSTGVPIVDAGMRSLWHTGFMHNRVRMIVASFLTKHLLVDWRAGEQWFWDTLVDADPANNPASWQWVAGSGADAAPYFRVFNPVTQGEKFDGDGAYVRRWVPEVAGLPDRFVHRPWEAPKEALAAAGITLGDTYPRPLVDLGEGRERALAAYARLRSAA